MFDIKELSFTHKISLFKTIIIGIGSTIGGGIFLLLAPGVKIAGSGIILAFVFNAVIALIIAGNYAEGASFTPVNGGGFTFVEKAFGKKALFIGWMVWLGNTSYAAMTSVGIGIYLSAIIPINEVIISVTVLFLFTFLNSVGSKRVASFQIPLTIILMLVLAIIAGYLFMNPIDGGFTPFLPNGVVSLLPATSLLFVCFTGFEAITTISAEIKKPQKNIPKALFYTVGIVSVSYILVIIATLYSTSIDRLGSSDIALMEAVKLSPVMQFIIIIGSVLAMLSSLNVALMASARNVYALSRDGFLPKKLSVINERFSSPIRAVLLTSVLAFILLLTNQVEIIASVSNLSYMLVVSSVGLAVFKSRPFEDKTVFKIPFYPYSCYLCIALPLILIPFLDLLGILIGFLWFTLGLLIHLFRRKRRKRRKA